KPEHGVVYVEWDHRRVRCRVRRGGRDPRRHGARLVDPLLEDLTGLVLAIEHEFVGILRPIKLSHLREDPELTEHALHTKGTALVRDDRNDALADRLVPQ